MFAAMRQRGHRYTFRDLLTGNCAIDATLFRRAGEFDEGLACHEDYELGIRLIGLGARFRFVEDAWGEHHERTTLARALERKRAEGVADVAIASTHPEIWPALPAGHFEAHASRRQRALRRLALSSPAAAAMARRSLLAAMAAHEGLRRRDRWARALYDLLSLAYWQGVGAAAGGRDGFRQLASRSATAPTVAPLEIDLACGLARAARTVDERRPAALVVDYHGVRVGTIAASPGAEALRGEHLQASLARELARPFLAAIGRVGAAAVRVEPRAQATGTLPTAPLEL
jgi:hypothetical protein